MANRTAKFAAVAAGVLAWTPLMASQHAANAAECLTEPRPGTPQGQHWYYRIERGTNRHCWYLREGGAGAQAAAADDSSSTPDAIGTGSEPGSRSLEDARAEFPAPQPRVRGSTGVTPAQAAPIAAPTATLPASSPFPSPPQAEPQSSDQVPAQTSAVSSRWPAPSDVASSSIAVASSSTAPAAADSSDPESDPQAAPAVAAAPPAAINAPAEKAPASLQMLFVVILGALALAGLTASVIYRFGRTRQIRIDPRQRRATLWDGVDLENASNPPPDPAPTPPWVEPVEPVVERTATPVRTERPRPRATAQSKTTQERYERFEEILAQLVKQAQQSDA